MACNRNLKGKIIEHTIELTDDNILLINKLDDKTLSFYLVGMSLSKRNIVKFTNIVQKEDIVYFNIFIEHNSVSPFIINSIFIFYHLKGEM